MTFPDFFAEVAAIRVRDPLLAFLGASADGTMEYRYADAVKLAGHSCPTVAGTWLMTRRGLAALYGAEVPERGGLRASFPQPAGAGVTGVMGAVVGLVTGAAGEGGFHGIAGSFSRANLLGFATGAPGAFRLQRIDTGAAVSLSYRPEVVPPDPAMRGLLDKTVAGVASADERKAFGAVWQDRVRRILIDHADDPEMVIVEAG